MEAGVVGGPAYWGVTAGDGPIAKVALGIGAPAVGFGVWGLIDFRRARRFAEPARLVQELVISGVAAAALYEAGRPDAGAALAALSIAYHTLVYATGQRLLGSERGRRVTRPEAPS